MHSLRIAATALVVLFASGCADTPEAATAAKRTTYEEPVYRTGSNIPVRDKTPMTEEEKANRAAESQRALEQLQRTGSGNPRNN
jgi:hypothetical protein